MGTHSLADRILPILNGGDFPSCLIGLQVLPAVHGLPEIFELPVETMKLLPRAGDRRDHFSKRHSAKFHLFAEQLILGDLQQIGYLLAQFFHALQFGRIGLTTI